jgi:hypothetical protein
MTPRVSKRAPRGVRGAPNLCGRPKAFTRFPCTKRPPYHEAVRRALIATVLVIWFVAGRLSARATRGQAQTPLTSNPPHLMVASARRESAQENAHPPALRTFTGAITKNGDQYVLNESKTHKLYELDDQDTAAKFATKTVTITGTLDTVKNVIHIQSIAEAQA